MRPSGALTGEVVLASGAVPEQFQVRLLLEVDGRKPRPTMSWVTYVGTNAFGFSTSRLEIDAYYWIEVMVDGVVSSQRVTPQDGAALHTRFVL
jgi:hypothetical protein